MGDHERQERRKIADKNPTGPIKRLYTIPEAAHYLGRTVSSLRGLIWKGEMPVVRGNGKRIFLDVREMDAYIERAKTRFTY